VAPVLMGMRVAAVTARVSSSQPDACSEDACADADTDDIATAVGGGEGAGALAVVQTHATLFSTLSVLVAPTKMSSSVISSAKHSFVGMGSAACCFAGFRGFGCVLMWAWACSDDPFSQHLATARQERLAHLCHLHEIH